MMFKGYKYCLIVLLALLRFAWKLEVCRYLAYAVI